MHTFGNKYFALKTDTLFTISRSDVHCININYAVDEEAIYETKYMRKELLSMSMRHPFSAMQIVRSITLVCNKV